MSNKEMARQEVIEILKGRTTPKNNPVFVVCDECDRQYEWNNEEINYVSVEGHAVVAHMCRMDTGEYLGIKYRCVCGNNLYRAY